MKTTSPNLVGESNHAAHPGWIELESFKWHGVTRADRSSKSTFGVFEIKKPVDRLSPHFMQFAAAGWAIASVVISVSNSDAGVSVDYDRYCLENVIVMSDAISANWDTRPTETVTLSYAKFERWYESRGTDGTKELVTTGWDTLAFRKFRSTRIAAASPNNRSRPRPRAGAFRANGRGARLGCRPRGRHLALYVARVLAPSFT